MSTKLSISFLAALLLPLAACDGEEGTTSDTAAETSGDGDGDTTTDDTTTGDTTTDDTTTDDTTTDDTTTDDTTTGDGDGDGLDANGVPTGMFGIHSMAQGSECSLQWSTTLLDGGPERYAKWDCDGVPDPVWAESKGSDLYNIWTTDSDGVDCRLEKYSTFGLHGVGDSEQLAYWECPGMSNANADATFHFTLVDEAEGTFKITVLANNAGLEWQSGFGGNDGTADDTERIAKFDSGSAGDPVYFEILN